MGGKIAGRGLGGLSYTEKLVQGTVGGGHTVFGERGSEAQGLESEWRERKGVDLP